MLIAEPSQLEPIVFRAVSANPTSPLSSMPLAATTTDWSPASPFAQRFSRVSGTRHKVSVFKVRESREPFGLSLRPSRWLWRE
jgi:hypothetical protein